MYIDMGERIAGKQHRPSLIIEGTTLPPPPQGPQNSQNLYFIYILAYIYMKNWLLIVFSCCAYVSTVMKSAFSDILLTHVY